MVPRNADTLGRGLSIPSRIARRKAGSGALCFGNGYISSVSRELLYSTHRTSLWQHTTTIVHPFPAGERLRCVWPPELHALHDVR